MLKMSTRGGEETGPQLGRDLEAGLARHGDIEDDHVGMQLCRKADRLVSVRGLTHNLESRLALQDVPDSAAYDRMIVRDENPYRSGRSLSCTVVECRHQYLQ